MRVWERSYSERGEHGRLFKKAKRPGNAQRSMKGIEGPTALWTIVHLACLTSREYFLQNAGNKHTYGESTKPPGRHHLMKEM